MSVPNQFVTPVDVEAENALIGAVCLLFYAPDWPLPEACRDIQPEDFMQPRAQAAWRAILACQQKRKPIDAVLAHAEGADYLYLVDCQGPTCCPTEAHVDWYARRVAEMAQRRRLIREGQELAKQGYLGDVPPSQPKRRRGIQAW